ncbi:RIP metalloprotease RseP [uncultured Bacteroides sp.]|jgi:regulator of sigma E protease|uniref:RIP metalloprotease RseP n=1 Tax=uncultured Bacteroides sp. TaxID=162156 RepID=UPI00280B3A78|nr:RIP metalloprotease RseP [uncultured Bacteroides sp.]
METFLIRALQLILSLSLLVIVHEGGHFFFARLFKIRVEKFYIFFDPWFSLFKYKPKNSDTEYGVGWLPLGGYCKISGMIDESMDTEQMKQPAQPWEFRSKPAWQRLLVMIGGVLMNFLLALFIYSMILFTWGDSYVALKDMTYGMKFNETAKEIGFRDGDILKSADGKELVKFDMDMLRSIVEAREVTVLRDGKDVKILMPELSLLDVAKEDPLFVATFRPNVVDSVIPGGGFAQAGIQKGDSLIAFNGTPLTSWNEFMDEMSKLEVQAELDKKESAGFSLVYSRNGLRDTVNVTTDSQFKVNALGGLLDYKATNLTYGFFESFPAGITLGVNTLKGYVNDMKYVFTKEGAKSVGGFGTIGSIFPKVWDWQRFWEMTAFLSIILAFMNILPIPALDGGHVLFLLYEIIARRKPSDKFLEYAQMVGMFLLFGLLIWANFNDILRFVF